jgi:putative polymerase
MPINDAMTTGRARIWLNPARWDLRALLSVPSAQTLAALTVCAATLFNFVLATVNANFFSLTRGNIILAEVAIVGTAAVICMRSFNRMMIPWALVLWLLQLILVLISMGHQEIFPKIYRDALIIPIFVALGIVYANGNVVRIFVVLQAIVLGVMLFEAISPVGYGSIFNPWDYYVQTRGFEGDAPWHGAALFQSAVRPDGRYLLGWLDIHRLSSLFLEPVSLGNWCIVITIFIVSLWNSMTFRERIFMVLSNVALLIGSDGRLALATIALIVVIVPFARLLPRYVYVLYLPIAVIVAVTLSNTFEFDPLHDDFPGRIAKSIEMLETMDFMTLLGLDHTMLDRAADSGISYVIITQSIFGLIVLWCAICFLQMQNTRRAIVFMHSLCIFISFILMISEALFTIKTAAVLWFLYGYISARGHLDRLPARPAA